MRLAKLPPRNETLAAQVPWLACIPQGTTAMSDHMKTIGIRKSEGKNKNC
jgi:hypothetical protein